MAIIASIIFFLLISEIDATAFSEGSFDFSMNDLKYSTALDILFNIPYLSIFRISLYMDTELTISWFDTGVVLSFD